MKIRRLIINLDVSRSILELSFLDFNNVREKNKLFKYIKKNFEIFEVCSETEDTLIMKIKNTEKEIVSREMIRILEFVKNIKTKLEFSNDFNMITQSYLLEENNRKKTLEQISRFKKKDFDNNVELLEFKNFCDNTLKVNLREYQYKSAYVLSTIKRGFEFSVPGAGKTIISYAVYNYLKFHGQINRLLVIGPKNAYNAWTDEFKLCFGYNPELTNLSNTTTNYANTYLKASEENQTEITFINIDKLRSTEKSLEKFLKDGLTMLIIDEGHKVKNPNAKVSKVALKLGKLTEHKIILTGTPMPNGYEDLFSLLKIIEPYEEIIPFSYSQLRSFTKSEPNENQKTELMNSLSPLFSRVSKKYLIKKGELKPSVHYRENTDMSFEQREIYNVLNEMAYNIDNQWETEFAMLMKKAIIIRKQQVSSNPALLNRTLKDVYTSYIDNNYEYDEDIMNEQYTEKLYKEIEKASLRLDYDLKNSRVGQLIQDFQNRKYEIPKNNLAVQILKEYLNKNKKVIIWDTFVYNMEVISNKIEEELNVQVGVINGSVVGEDRQKIIDDFRDGYLNVLVASAATLAESISLHRASQHAIYLNRNYNAAQFIQSKDRIHRINMPDETTATYHYIINDDSIDEIIDERLELKEKRMLEILDSDSLSFGDLESDEFTHLSVEDIETSYLR